MTEQTDNLKDQEIARLGSEVVELRTALERRNEVEGKAHALFTEPLDGYTFAHTPDQCDPLGFVVVLRAAIKHLLDGKPLPKPFIYLKQRLESKRATTTEYSIQEDELKRLRAIGKPS